MRGTSGQRRASGGSGIRRPCNAHRLATGRRVFLQGCWLRMLALDQSVLSACSLSRTRCGARDTLMSMAITLKPPAVNDSDDTLLRISRDNPGYRVARAEDGTITMSPTHTEGGAKSGEAYYQLRL